MSTKRRMTGVDFAAVRPFLKISAERIEAARQVMVDGKTMTTVGAGCGWTKQAVDNAVRTVWVAFGQYNQSKAVSARMEAAQRPAVENGPADTSYRTHGNSRSA